SPSLSFYLYFFFFSFQCPGALRDLHSFPTRRSSDLAMEVLDLARDSLNPELELLGVCLNIANMRTRHARQTLDALQQRFGAKMFRTVIRQSIAYAESAERAIPILDYRPDRGTDYLPPAAEILR